MLKQSSSSHAVVADAGVLGKQQNCLSFLVANQMSRPFWFEAMQKTLDPAGGLRAEPFQFLQLRDDVRAISAWGSMSGLGVRRAKAALSSGCKPHPTTAPVGSNRTSHVGNGVAEAGLQFAIAGNAVPAVPTDLPVTDAFFAGIKSF